jgi:hypothetical protein
VNLKHRLVDRHNNNNNSSGVPPAVANINASSNTNNKDLYEDEHDRPLLDTTETDSLDLTHIIGGKTAAESGGGGGELSVNSPESLLSSPGRPQPVKFDFNAVDAAKGGDSVRLHPFYFRWVHRSVGDPFGSGSFCRIRVRNLHLRIRIQLWVMYIYQLFFPKRCS